MPVPSYWTWTNRVGPLRFFWSNPYEIKVVIVSLTEMLQLPNFGHMNTSTIKSESSDEILLVTPSTEIMTPYPLIQFCFSEDLRWPFLLTSSKLQLQERTLRIAYNNFNLSFSKLLKMANESTIYKFLLAEVYKLLNGLSSTIMNEVFNLNTNLQ